MSYRPYASIIATAVAGTKVETFVLSGIDITNKYVTLSSSPSAPIDTVLMVKSAPNQYYGDDFLVSGNQLSWSGLELDGILSAGDELTVIFKS